MAISFSARRAIISLTAGLGALAIGTACSANPEGKIVVPAGSIEPPTTETGS